MVLVDSDTTFSALDGMPDKLADAVSETIRQEGYAIIHDALPTTEQEAIRAALEPWMQGDLMGRNDFEGYRSERVYAVLAKSAAFASIIENPITMPVLERLLNPSFLLSACLAINLHPGETEQNFHRDNAGVPGSAASATNGISTIWAFDDFTEENGGTEIIPGSHLWTNETPAPDDPRRMQVIMPKGSVVVYSGSLYHRGGANHSKGTRLAVTPQYCQPWLRQLENMVLAVPPGIAGQYSERIQELLGYSIREPGFMGYVDGMHPKRLIDKDYRGRKARGRPS